MDVAQETVRHFGDNVRKTINNILLGLEPWQVCTYTCATTCAIFVVYFRCTQSRLDMQTRIKKMVFGIVKKVPWVKAKIIEEKKKTMKALYEDVHKYEPNAKFLTQLPSNGISQEEIVETAMQYENLGTFDVARGHVSGTVYTVDPNLADLSAKIFRLYCYSNPLHPDVFPGCRKMEAEVVQMVADMFHGDSNTCGVVTSGGTESLLLICLACRNRAYMKGINKPEMVLPVTAHAAFDKAADYFGIRIKHVPIDEETYKVDLRKMRSAITSNTCMLVVSCPGFPHGIIDPIEEVGQLGVKYDIPVHVDACLGGFLVAFMNDAGYPIKPFDFSVPGVTSISCDTHKYAFAVKGSSVLLYKSKKLLHFQYFCQPDWPGGIYASPTLAGSRSGANIAACWASLLYHGRQGYIDSTCRIITVARQIEAGLRKIPGILILGQPEVSVIAFTSDVFNVYNLSDRLTKLGWHLNALQFPTAIHICLTMTHTAPGVAENFVNDTKRITAELMSDPVAGGKTGHTAAIYGTAQKIPDRTIVADLSFSFLDACYSTNPTPVEDDDD